MDLFTIVVILVAIFYAAPLLFLAIVDFTVYNKWYYCFTKPSFWWNFCPIINIILLWAEMDYQLNKPEND